VTPVVNGIIVRRRWQRGPARLQSAPPHAMIDAIFYSVLYWREINGCVFFILGSV
jgi:hypothetical protein